VEEKPVNATHRLQDIGQSLWLDNITRDLLTTNTLKRYIYDNLWITALTSNPIIFDHAISHSTSYDDDIRRLAARDMPTEALAFGKTVEALAAEGSPAFQTPFRVCEGNRPTNLVLAERLDPRTLGALVALDEHNVFTQGAVWGIDSFDQWGVELSKVLAQRIIPELESGTAPSLKHDSSTNTLIRRYRELRGRPALKA
jgi:hypothetical protein